MAPYRLQVNGHTATVESWDPAQPLLNVLRNAFGLHSPKFGCGLGQSGARGALRQWRPSAAHTGYIASVARQQRLEAYSTSSRRWANHPACEALSMSVPLFHMITGAPEPVAPLSHAVEQDGWVFVTGQLPFTGIANDSPYPEGIEAQTRQVLANLQQVLAGC